MKNSISSTIKLRASSAKPRKAETPLNIQKREKLKQLLIEKLIKKLNISASHKIQVEKEVSQFIQKDKLTEQDLKGLEENIKQQITQLISSENLKNTLDKQNESKLEISDISHKDNYTEYSKSIYSANSQISEDLSKFNGIKYDEITNFELRKLLQNEKRPIQRTNPDSNTADDWAAVIKYKTEKLEQIENQNKLKERNKKIKQREYYMAQIKEKQENKQKQDINEEKYHRVLLDNLEKQKEEQNKKKEDEMNRRKLDKEIRQKQIEEKADRKIKEFTKDRMYDKNTLENINKQNEVEKKKELEKQKQAKQSLYNMLQENEDYKQKQIIKNKIEREADIKAMEEYKKILDKQEQDRIAYFKKCERRQYEAMNRMAETVTKKENEKIIEEEEKLKSELEEEERRKNYVKDSKIVMREFLLSQMNEKKEFNKTEKKIGNEQMDIWNRENSRYYEKKKEIDEKMKNNTKLYAEFLKSQMKDKRAMNEKMNEEEFRLNREIIEEMTSKTPSVSKRNFFI